MEDPPKNLLDNDIKHYGESTLNLSEQSSKDSVVSRKKQNKLLELISYHSNANEIEKKIEDKMEELKSNFLELRGYIRDIYIKFSFTLGNLTLFKCDFNLLTLWLDSQDTLFNWGCSDVEIIDLSRSYGCKIYRQRSRYLQEIVSKKTIDTRYDYSLLRIECNGIEENFMELEFPSVFFDEMVQDIINVTSDLDREWNRVNMK